MTLADRWLAVWTALRLPVPDGAAFLQIVARYREPHRAYHTEQHLGECLDWLDRARDSAADPLAVELALWYHDLVYWPRRSDNEEASADVAETHLAAAGAAATLIHRVKGMILCTRHDGDPPPGDEALTADIDLAILGAAPGRYAEYEEQVRREYAWVPGFVYRRRRAEILQAFLARPRLYTTPFLFERLEGPARTNVAASLDRLTAGRSG